MVNSKYPTRSTDRNEVITNVPAIISTNASPSPTNTVPPSNPLTNLVAPLATKRYGRALQKTSTAIEQLSSENDIKMSHAPNWSQQQHQHHQPTPPLIQFHSQARSDDLAYCTKCGGLTTHDKQNLTKKRYFSLDKERNERTTNFLQCIAMNRIDTPKSGSDNLLSNSRKQCSFDGAYSEKSFGRMSNSNINNSSIRGKVKQPQQQSQDSGCNQMKNGTNASFKKVGGGAGSSNTHRDCTTSCSNRSLKDKSNKSSQNSLREPRTNASRKNSIFHFSSFERDASTKSKRISQQYARKASTRGPINLHEEQDSETREILLGISTSHSKFDKFPHEIKIPEPVEAVR